MKKKHDENPELPDKKFSIYESAGKFFIKTEDSEEREITKYEYLHLKEGKENDFKKNNK